MTTSFLLASSLTHEGSFSTPVISAIELDDISNTFSLGNLNNIVKSKIVLLKLKAAKKHRCCVKLRT